MFIEITNNKINNLIRTKWISHGTRYTVRLHDTKKGFQRVSNFCHIDVTLYLMRYLSNGFWMGYSFSWEYNIMPPCIVYNQCVLRGHWPALSQPHFFKENESCGMPNSVSTRWCAIFIFILATITIHAAKTNKSFCSTENFPQRQVGSRVTMCIVCMPCLFPPDSNFYGNKVSKAQCAVYDINCTSPLLWSLDVRQ